MRTIFLLLITYGSVMSQENFLNTDNVLKWQKVFTTELSGKEVVNGFLSNGLILDPVKTDSTISGQCFCDVNHQSIGLSAMEVKIYVSQYDVQAYCTVDTKKGKYRLTMSNIDLIKANGEEEYVLSDFALKKNGDWKRHFIKDSAPIYDQLFINRFTLTKKNDDW